MHMCIFCKGLEENRGHSTILDTEGFEAEIDSYIDSDEYQTAFGENIVPYIRGYKTSAGISMVEFTHMFAMVRGASSSDFKGSLAGKSSVLNQYVIQGTPIPVVAPSGGTAGEGWSYRKPAIASSGRQGSGAGEDGKVYRVEVTAYRSKAVNRVSKFRRSNKVYFVPFDQLSETYQRIHKQGGTIASITPV